MVFQKPGLIHYRCYTFSVFVSKPNMGFDQQGFTWYVLRRIPHTRSHIVPMFPHIFGKTRAELGLKTVQSITSETNIANEMKI